MYRLNLTKRRADDRSYLFKLHDIRGLVIKIKDCAVISTSNESCIIKAPDITSACYVEDMLVQNNIRVHQMHRGHFIEAYYLSVQYN